MTFAPTLPLALNTDQEEDILIFWKSFWFHQQHSNTSLSFFGCIEKNPRGNASSLLLHVGGIATRARTALTSGMMTAMSLGKAQLTLHKRPDSLSVSQLPSGKYRLKKKKKDNCHKSLPPNQAVGNHLPGAESAEENILKWGTGNRKWEIKSRREPLQEVR